MLQPYSSDHIQHIHVCPQCDNETLATSGDDRCSWFDCGNTEPLDKNRVIVRRGNCID